jgi:hypothetical protein
VGALWVAGGVNHLQKNQSLKSARLPSRGQSGFVAGGAGPRRGGGGGHFSLLNITTSKTIGAAPAAGAPAPQSK